MNCESLVIHKVADDLQIFKVKRGTAAAVVSVLQADQSGPGIMDVVPTNGCLDVRQGKRPIRSVGKGVRMDPAQGCDPPRLIQEDVGPVAHDDLLPPGAVGEKAGEVRHGPAGDKQGCLFSHHGGGQFLELVDGGILAENIVPELGVHHCLFHGKGGKGDGVTSKVDDPHGYSPGVHPMRG